MASSSSRGHNKSYKYDVFLSFRGEDTRKTFVGHLFAALDRQGIYTFKDDERLDRGKEIDNGLLRAIEDSRFYIIVFSKSYASSSWCLNELLKIMECTKTKGHAAFPLFYDVDPSDIRKQTGSVGEALATHKNESEVGKWRKALKEAAGLSGLDVRNTANGHEAKVIEMIIEWVSLELRPFNMCVDENLIGMEQRIQDLDSYLNIGLKDVRIVGIKGIGGSGKTTLAGAIFDKLSINFEGKSFVESVREKASKLGLEKLQEQILKDVLKDKNITVSGVLEGKNLMRNRLPGKEILVVLDDVDSRDQLEMLVGDLSWFKPGSRIIITTRYGEVLEEHHVKRIHDVNLLSEEEAIRLFSRHAFGKDIPTQGYEKRTREVVSYALGLSLTVKVLGSKLCGKDERQWTYTLERLKPLKETLKILELSYESLEYEHKEIFLYVACFLRGSQKDDAIRMLECCGLNAKDGLRVLEQKSLIVTNDADIDMHDHIEEMGKNIASREHLDEPHKRSRLWVQEEIEHVLANTTGSKEARWIDVKFTPSNNLKGLGNMKKLECLIVNYGDLEDWNKFDEARLRFTYWFKYPNFPNSLRYLYWYGYPYRCLPKTFEASNLVSLEMPRSKIKQLWEGGKVMEKLKFLNLSWTKLRSLDLGLTPNLERLNLKDCEDLVKLDVHGGCLKSLVYLNLYGCYSVKSSISFIEELESLEVLNISNLNLREFPDYIIKGHTNNSLLELDLSWNEDIEEIPSSIGNLHNLVSLKLSYCKSLESLPESICSLRHLTTLDLHSTNILELPEDIGQLECLQYLDLYGTEVTHLPNSICMLNHLKTLILEMCQSLEKLPEDVGELECLEKLDLGGCYNLREIPSSICKLKHLKELKLNGCKRIEKLPEDVGELESLEILNLYHCDNLREVPSSIRKLKHIKDLDLYSCKGIEKLPEEVGNLGSLQSLDIRYTGITHLPQNISLLKGLKIEASESIDEISEN